MIWFIIMSFLTFDGWTHHVPIEPPYGTVEDCQKEARLLQDKLVDMWPDEKANVKEIKVECFTARPYGTSNKKENL